MNKKEIFYQDKRKCKSPFTHISEEVKEPALGMIDELYGAADILSIENAEKHRNLLLALSAVGTLLTIFLLLYDEAELHSLILACIFMIIMLFLIDKLAKKADYHRKYIEYRVLAETLRVQYFLSIAGVTEKVANLLPWFTKKALPWIEEVLVSLPDVELDEPKSILDYWIRNQKSYHEIALVKSKAKKKRNDRITKIVIAVTVLSYFVALLFEIYLYKVPANEINIELFRSILKPLGLAGINVYALEPSEIFNMMRAILKIVLGAMSAITIFTGSYYGKMSLDNTIKDHERMIALYDKTEKDFLDNEENEEILIYLAKEFLIENITWYAYQSNNKPDIVI